MVLRGVPNGVRRGRPFVFPTMFCLGDWFYGNSQNIFIILTRTGKFYLPSAVHATDSLASRGEFDEVVVTASRIAQPIAQVGVSVDVLNRDDLTQRNAASLADILRTVPGINVSNSGGLGKATSVFIRGEDAFRTRLYIDGIAVSDTTATQISPRFDALLNQQLGKVEVLKAPSLTIRR